MENSALPSAVTATGDRPAAGVEFARLSKGLSAASLHEAAGKIGALPSRIKPLSSNMQVAGTVFPVRCKAGDNLYLHHAVYTAGPGDVLVVQTEDYGEGVDFGHWGDVLTSAAQLRGIAGLIITGGVRDFLVITAMEFPVFAGSLSIRGTGKNPRASGSLGDPIEIGDVVIKAGDFVFGDADGIVVLPAALANRAIEDARARDADEDKILQRLRAGETTLEIYKLPDLASPTERPAVLRRSFNLSGLSHAALPIPTVSRVANIVATGGIRGVDRVSGAIPTEAQKQTELMFENLQIAIEAAGALVNDIVKVTIWIANAEVRATLDAPWTALFPDPDSRPARHVLIYDLPGGMLVQCEAIAFDRGSI